MENVQRFEGQPGAALPGWRHPFWNTDRSRWAQWTSSPAMSERILLAVGLWTMLALVGLAIIGSRYLLPILLAASVLLAAGLRVAGVV